jgi:hypothetical protein
MIGAKRIRYLLNWTRLRRAGVYLVCVQPIRAVLCKA